MVIAVDGALEMEGREAHSILEREAFSGAQRFASGRGRGGRFDDHTDKAMKRRSFGAGCTYFFSD